MDLRSVFLRAGKVLSDHSPAILTGVGVVGTLTTAYLTGKATFQAVELINQEQIDRNLQRRDGYGEILTPKDKLVLTWKLYLPAASSAAMTIGCVILANRIGTRRTAAMASVLAISEKAFEEYQKKVAEKFGDRKESDIHTAVAQDYVTKNPPPDELMLMDETRSVLCCDMFTGRYFLSDMETLRRAENDINYQILHDFYASVSDFYHRIGLDSTSFSDEVGWNSEKMLELRFDSILTPQGRPCLAMDFKVVPITGYCRVQ